MSNLMGKTIEPLGWDAGFFGLNIARVASHTTSPEHWRQIRDEARAAGVACLYFLADINDAPTQEAVVTHGLRHVDTRLEFERKLGAAPVWSPAVRAATQADIDHLKPLARVSHVDSRFFHDPGFDRQRCAELYATWLQNSFEGFAREVLVFGETPVGYITLHDHQDHGQIGIIAVSEDARGAGVGRALIEAAHARYAAWGCPSARVVTQLRNISAQRLYQANGYRIAGAQHWYHDWPSNAD